MLVRAEPEMIQKGYVLLESLVAMLLLTVGMLGVIGLQARTIAVNTQSQQRMQASLYASELVGLASADPVNAGCYAVLASPSADCSSYKASSLAAKWAEAALNGLPNSEVATSLAADGTFSVTLQWKRDQEATTHNYVLTTRVVE